ncbi:MAG: hypothetical protein IT449_08970 [Phycisphaerales bacterium]|nr:hypothetical protein [Phycisphaerales bacterium]
MRTQQSSWLNAACVRGNPRVGIVTSALVFCSVAAATACQQSRKEQLIEVILDTTRGLECARAYNELSQLTGEERTDALRVICLKAHESYAMAAAGELIESSGTSNLDTVLARLPDSSEAFQRTVLTRVSGWRDPDACCSLARQVLRTITEHPDRIRPYAPDGDIQAVDQAALLLGRWSKDPRDTELIVQVAMVVRNTCGTWLALCGRDRTPELTERARAAFHDDSLDTMVRCAAAAFLAASDEDAADFVRRRASDYLDEFSGWNKWDAVERSRSSQQGDPQFVEQVQRSRRGLQIFAMLLPAKADDAKAIYRRGATSTNHDIQVSSCLAFAIRWPDEFAEVERSLRERPQTEATHDALLAVLVKLHPGMRDQAVRLASEQRLIASLQNLEISGSATWLGCMSWMLLVPPD